MSDYEDGIELDDDELEELMSDNPDHLTPEDVFSMVMLNKRDKKRVWVELEDEDGDTIELADMLEELVKYIKDKLGEEEGNQMLDQIMPLMSQSLVSGLGRMMGLNATAFLVFNPQIRMALIYMMLVSFTLYKVVQSKGLVINTCEEDITDEEINEIDRKSKASSVANMSAMLGMDPKEALRQMVERGDITEGDLSDLLGLTKEEDEDDS